MDLARQDDDGGAPSPRATELERKIELKKAEIAASECDMKNLKEMLLAEKDTTKRKRTYDEFMTAPSGPEDERTYLPSHIDAAIDRTKKAIGTLEGNLTWYNSLKSKTDALVGDATTPAPVDKLTDWEVGVLKAVKAWCDSDRIHTTELSGAAALQMGQRLVSMRDKFQLAQTPNDPVATVGAPSTAADTVASSAAVTPTPSKRRKLTPEEKEQQRLAKEVKMKERMKEKEEKRLQMATRKAEAKKAREEVKKTMKESGGKKRAKEGQKKAILEGRGWCLFDDLEEF